MEVQPTNRADDQLEAVETGAAADDEKQLAVVDKHSNALAELKAAAPPLPPWAEPNAANGLALSRHALSISSQASELGFALARKGTSLGFAFARKILSPFLMATGGVIDTGLGLDPHSVSATKALGTAVTKGIDAIEFCTLFGVNIGEYTTKASLTLANRSVATIEEVYGGDEAVRALGVFVGLVRREWNVQMPGDPPGGIAQFSIVEIARATALWASLQAVTGPMYGRRIASELQEVDLARWRNEEKEPVGVEESEGEGEQVLFEITNEEVLGSGEIITAEVKSTLASPPPESVVSVDSFSSAVDDTDASAEEQRIRQALRRYSKLCLGAYGGLGVLFFGIKVPSLIPDNESLVSTRAAAIEAADDASQRPAAQRIGLGSGPSREELATLERRLEESNVAEAWSPNPDRSRYAHSASRSPVVRSAIVSPRPVETPLSSGYEGESESAGDEDDEDEVGKSPPLRAADYGLPFTPPVHDADREPAGQQEQRMFSAWEMLTGNHDLELLGRIGEFDHRTARLGAARHGDLSDTVSSSGGSDDDDDDDSDEPGHAIGRTGTPLGLPASSTMPADDITIPEEVPVKQEGPLKTKYVQIGSGKWRSRRRKPSALLAAGAAADAKDAVRNGKGEPTKHERRALRAERRAARRARRAQAARGRRPPRYFVITDHPRRTVVVCLRGTLSIDDIATDLTCEEAEWDPKRFWDAPYTPEDDAEGHAERLLVHEGFLEIATAMGGPDGPVTRTVARMLKANPGFDLCVVGHSLGAGIASLLGLIWADPRTCLTTHKSGLPPGVKVKVFGFAPPASVSAHLSILSRPLIHSFAYSSDAVTRLSLGHIRDIRSAAAWLCYVDRQPQADKKRENVEQLWQRILTFRRGMKDRADGYDLEARMSEEEWLVSLRKTLEANMTEATLFPPGDIFWLVKGDDLDLPGDAAKPDPAQPRLFRVTGRPDVVFKPMLFATNMLKSHLPTSYSQVIAEYL